MSLKQRVRWIIGASFAFFTFIFGLPILVTNYAPQIGGWMVKHYVQRIAEDSGTKTAKDYCEDRGVIDAMGMYFVCWVGDNDSESGPDGNFHLAHVYANGFANRTDAERDAQYREECRKIVENLGNDRIHYFNPCPAHEDDPWPTYMTSAEIFRKQIPTISQSGS